MNHYSINQLINKLAQQGLLQNKSKVKAWSLCQLNHDEVPLYVHIWTGIGTLLGTLFLVGLLYALSWLNLHDMQQLLGTGLVLIIAALTTIRLFKRESFTKIAFLQLSLIMMLCGQLLFAYGLSKLLDVYTDFGSEFRLLISFALIWLVTYFSFPSKTNRFIISLILWLSFFLVCILHKDYFISGGLIFALVVCGALFLYPLQNRIMDPFAYASILGLTAITTLATVKPMSGGIAPIYMNLILTLALAIVLYVVFHPRRKHGLATIALTTVGIIALLFLSNPGIILSLTLLVLGYWKHDRVITVYALLFLTLFIFYYYYDLHVTLMQKSIILIGSGVVLFALSYAISKLNNQGGEHA